MKFFDANILYGIPSSKKIYAPVPDCQTLLSKLKEFGIEKAIVHREEQFFNAPAAANKLLADEIRHTDRLWGIWTILPEHCNEIVSPDKILSVMKENRIIGWQFFPAQNKYLFHWRVLRRWFELAETNNIPLFIDLKFVPGRDLFDVLDKYPGLTVILRNSCVWPPDRIIRPYMSDFPNAYLELSYYLVPGGIEDLVANGFTERILFSTHFQTSHPGGPMLMLKHAEISEDEKALIASGNLEYILQEIKYDKL